MDLKYLFQANFKDGFLTQTAADVSSIDPAKSAFYDVRMRMDQVESFGIFNDEHTWAVDLTDGHFEHNGISFTLPCEELTDDCVFRLIYYRKHKHSFTDGIERDHTIEFCFGWQTTIDGKNYQRTISVS